MSITSIARLCIALTGVTSVLAVPHPDVGDLASSPPPSTDPYYLGVQYFPENKYCQGRTKFIIDKSIGCCLIDKIASCDGSYGFPPDTIVQGNSMNMVVFADEARHQTDQLRLIPAAVSKLVFRCGAKQVVFKRQGSLYCLYDENGIEQSCLPTKHDDQTPVRSPYYKRLATTGGGSNQSGNNREASDGTASGNEVEDQVSEGGYPSLRRLFTLFGALTDD